MKREERMDAEMRFHLESLIREYVRQGMTLEAAAQRARSEFGPVELAKDECRDESAFQWAEHLWRDLRLASRSLRKSLGFAAAAVLTLALGIGANTAIFSAVYAVLLKPLPYVHPEQLYTVDISISKLPELGRLTGRIQDYIAWRKSATLFSGVAGMSPGYFNLTGSGEPERVGGALVTSDFFTVLGVPPAHGRTFVPDEDKPGQSNVIVISDGLWRRRFAADPDIVGKTVVVDGRSQRIIGVTPPSFLVPTGKISYLPFAERIDLWKPRAPTDAELQNENWNEGLLLRLKAGVAAEAGRQQLEAILNSKAPPNAPPGLRFVPRLIPIRDVYASRVRLRLVLLLGASGLLLLIACTNTASLFLARIASRATEFATRMALGAGRARVMVHMLAESFLLALAGCGLGLLLAAAGIRVLMASAPTDVGLLRQAGLNLPVLLFAIAASLSTGLASGFFPAWRACRKDAALVLQEGARAALGGLRATRARQVLVGLEMALGTALLASAALLLHSFVKVMNADRGYVVDNVLTVDLSLSGESYAKPQQQLAFYRELTDRLRALPGVSAAGGITLIPATGVADFQVVLLDGNTEQDILRKNLPIAGYWEVTPGYFAASGTTLLAGRYFQQQDAVTTAVISESLAKRLWPAESLTHIIGHQFRQGDPVHSPLVTIVGIVADIRPGAIDRDLRPQIYRPFLPPRVDTDMSVLVRTAQAPAVLTGAIRQEIRKLDPNVPIPAIRTMREIVSAAVAERRFQMQLTALFALLALLLGAIGIYGVVSYAVACRTRDIGLRMALGASEQDILGSVLANGLRPVLFGLAAGLCAAIGAAHVLRSLLYGIAPGDPVALAGVAGLLLVTAALACYLPARRASRLEPAAALRHE